MASSLKYIVDGLLKIENRPLSWLASEMGKTPDGLKLSLMKGSLKYNDIKKMASILRVQPDHFFQNPDDLPAKFVVAEDSPAYASMRTELVSCKELVDTLKSQVKDKEKIIELLGGSR